MTKSLAGLEQQTWHLKYLEPSTPLAYGVKDCCEDRRRPAAGARQSARARPDSAARVCGSGDARHAAGDSGRPKRSIATGRLAHRTGQRSGGPGDRESHLAATVRARPGRFGRLLWSARRAADASGAARLSGRAVHPRRLVAETSDSRARIEPDVPAGRGCG